MTTVTSDIATTDRAPGAAKARGIEGVYRPPPIHWVGDGFRVHGYFSAIPGAMRKLSPFLMLDYHPAHDYAPTSKPRGVGVHPHRGFETVTIAFQGSVAPPDSTGAGGVIGPGDVQWMTAASGVLHKEYHEESYARRGGPFQMAQLWVNLPRAHKMDPPRYQGIVSRDIGVATLPDGAGELRVVAGEHHGAKGPAKTFSTVDLLTVRLVAGKKVELDFPASKNVGLVVMEGEVSIAGREARLHDFVVFDHEGDVVAIEAKADAELLVLGGAPIDEPIASYGPFVMTSKEEIVQAIEDFQDGKFGHLT
jgi:redox-sensitive bicupin YhaK (pirin superfamily)